MRLKQFCDVFSCGPAGSGAGSGSGSSAAHSRGNIHLTTSLDVLLSTVFSFSFINKHSLLLLPPSSCCCSFVFFRLFLLRCSSSDFSSSDVYLISAAQTSTSSFSCSRCGSYSFFLSGWTQISWILLSGLLVCELCVQSEALITDMWTHQKQDGRLPRAGRR